MGRWVWCRALSEQRARRVRGERYAGYAEMCKWLTAWRHDAASKWLSDGPIHPQQQVLRRLDEAYRRFLGRTGGFPSFKRRGDEPGIRFPDPKELALDQENGRVKLPKLGWLRLRQSCAIKGTLRNVTVTSEGSGAHQKWFCSIQVQTGDATPLCLAPTLGIDLGLASFAAMSDGRTVAPLRAMAKQAKRLKFAQRAVSRKKRGSANRKKAIQRLGTLHRRIAYQRSDWLHKLTHELAGQHAVIAIEDLRVKNMSASAAGTVDAPGTNVRQKAGLNRSIHDAAWGEFRRQLTYKLEWRGGRVIPVNPAYTSRTCRICGHECAENRKSQELFQCVACGHAENADVHAAKNILAAGHAVWAMEQASAGSAPVACGGVVRRPRGASRAVAAPTKQEPTEAKGLA